LLTLAQKEVKMFDLYMMEACPYCHKVMDYLDKNNIKYRKYDIMENSDYKKDLIALGGKEQVPFLYNEETDDRIYESDEIIEYISEFENK